MAHYLGITLLPVLATWSRYITMVSPFLPLSHKYFYYRKSVWRNVHQKNRIFRPTNTFVCFHLIWESKWLNVVIYFKEKCLCFPFSYISKKEHTHVPHKCSIYLWRNVHVWFTIQKCCITVPVINIFKFVWVDLLILGILIHLYIHFHIHTFIYMYIHIYIQNNLKIFLKYLTTTPHSHWLIIPASHLHDVYTGNVVK